MAYADYWRCDRCDVKAFYDANLNYANSIRPDGKMVPEHNVGDMAVLCKECAIEYEIIWKKKDPS